MKLLPSISLLSVLVLPIKVNAQVIPIHGHSQKAVYNSSLEWPTVSSQCHWDKTLTGIRDTSHTHIDITGPLYGEVSGNLRLPFKLTLHRTAGRVAIPLEYQDRVIKIEWDETGSEVPPTLIGDPNGTKTWTGHLTYDIFKRTEGRAEPVVHGWWSPQVYVLTFLDDGAALTQEFFTPFWSVVDRNAPVLEWPNFPVLDSRCAPGSPPTRINPPQWGVNFITTGSFLPLNPIFEPWTFAIGTAAYGGLPLANEAQVQTHADFDLHAGNEGIILNLTRGNGDIAQTTIIDPLLLGTGPHKIGFFRFTPDGDEMVTSLLVFNLTVGVGTPPPPVLCQDQTASNIGQPLPCIYNNTNPPLPPPIPRWLSFLPSFFKLEGTSQIKVCTPDDKCLILGNVQ